MSTRTGDLDPGVVVHLARTHGIDPERIERVLDRQSGLVALSGGRADMRELLAARAGDADADLAVTAFCTSARKWIGAYAALLGGLDTLVFTGGIGEHAAPVRAEICAPLDHLGIALDTGRNERSDAVISADGTACVVRVQPTDEESTVARETASVLGLASGA
jgi:acetate kinase